MTSDNGSLSIYNSRRWTEVHNIEFVKGSPQISKFKPVFLLNSRLKLIIPYFEFEASGRFDGVYSKTITMFSSKYEFVGQICLN